MNSEPLEQEEINKKPKFKSMLLNGIWTTEPKSSSNLSNLDIFLENEKNNNSNEPWSKLDKTVKMKKLLVYAEMYKQEKQLEETEYEELVLFFKDCLDRKKIQRVKDVVYDKVSGLIKEIPGLLHNKPNNHFTIKNVDKRISTLKSLAPKKCKGTAKNMAYPSSATTTTSASDSE